jgi:hypothetical protein
MPTDISRLQSLVTESVGDLTARLDAGRITPLAWARQMEAVIVRAHTAATIAAITDRTGVAPRGLSRAERADLQVAIAAQRPYLRGFAQDVRAGGLSPEAVQRRAELYAGPVRATYSKARWEGKGLPAFPADGSTACKAWCKCAWVEEDDGFYWRLGASEHCGDCLTNAARWAPWRG